MANAYEKIDGDLLSTLNNRIDELEDLLKQRQKDSRIDNIPVLEDVVEFSEDSLGDDSFIIKKINSNGEFTEEDHSHTIENIDESITAELEGLVNILKNEEKDTISTDESRENCEAERRISEQHTNKDQLNQSVP